MSGSRPARPSGASICGPSVKWQDGSPFTADDVVFSLQRIQAKTSSMRAPMSHGEGSAQDRRSDGGFRNQPARPDLPAGADQLPDHVKAWCEAHQRDRAGDHRRQGRQLRRAQRHGHRAVQAGLARARPQDGRGAAILAGGTSCPATLDTRRVRRDHPAPRPAWPRCCRARRT